jgi:arabinose-5-phosphate isomerase
MDEQTLIREAKALLHAEAAVIASVAEQMDETFVKAVHMIAGVQRHVYATGAGTSGAVAKRFSHLLATCGVPAFYLTPGDALHGESAMIGAGDVLVALSKAGKSSELNQLAKIARERGAQVMCWTANPQSELATLSDLVIVLPTYPEAEGEGILPFGSTLQHGAYGDALTLMVKRLRGFDLAQMTQTHPMGGVTDLIKPAQGAQG